LIPVAHAAFFAEREIKSTEIVLKKKIFAFQEEKNKKRNVIFFSRSSNFSSLTLIDSGAVPSEASEYISPLQPPSSRKNNAYRSSSVYEPYQPQARNPSFNYATLYPDPGNPYASMLMTTEAQAAYKRDRANWQSDDRDQRRVSQPKLAEYLVAPSRSTQRNYYEEEPVSPIERHLF